MLWILKKCKIICCSKRHDCLMRISIKGILTHENIFFYFFFLSKYYNSYDQIRVLHYTIVHSTLHKAYIFVNQFISTGLHSFDQPDSTTFRITPFCINIVMMSNLNQIYIASTLNPHRINISSMSNPHQILVKSS